MAKRRVVDPAPDKLRKKDLRAPMMIYCKISWSHVQLHFSMVLTTNTDTNRLEKELAVVKKKKGGDNNRLQKVVVAVVVVAAKEEEKVGGGNDELPKVAEKGGVADNLHL